MPDSDYNNKPVAFHVNAAELRWRLTEKQKRRNQRGFLGNIRHVIEKRISQARETTVRNRSSRKTPSSGGKKRTLRKNANKRKTKKSNRK
jgi:hypothetical protein